MSCNITPRTESCTSVHEYTILQLELYVFHRERAILGHCIAANCSTSGKDHSLHEFPRGKALHTKWMQIVKHYQSN